MNFKSILSIAAGTILALAVFTSCSDDSSGSDPVLPSVTAPSAANVLVGESVELSFNVSTAEGYSSSSVSASNGTASVTSEPSSGATSGSVVVEFSASAAGAGSVELTVTDQEGQTDDATAVVSVAEEETTIRIVDNITEDTTWETGKIYILGGRIAVEAGATLTIEEGVIVKGEAGTGANATALLVARDATLNANGTAENPIIFTSVADEIVPDGFNRAKGSPNLDPDINGLWGGVIILGNAPISAATSPAQIEGIPTSDTNGLYGGDDPTDSSGTIRYISIRHGGSNIGEGNEINGLSLGGVGSGTVIENVEVVANQDDGIEWFGGNVDIDGIVIWNSGDDGLDTDQDWIGTASNFLIVTPQGGSAFELDGPEGDLNRGCHMFSNGIIYAGADIDHLVDFDDNTNAGLMDVYFYGLDSGYSAGDDFNPVETFGGDGNCTSGNWEYTLAEGGATVDQIFTGVPGAALTEVAANANSVGPDISRFSWTWASTSGALGSIGLE
jgi:hypothetical protein